MNAAREEFETYQVPTIGKNGLLRSISVLGGAQLGSYFSSFDVIVDVNVNVDGGTGYERLE